MGDVGPCHRHDRGKWESRIGEGDSWGEEVGGEGDGREADDKR